MEKWGCPTLALLYFAAVLFLKVATDISFLIFVVITCAETFSCFSFLGYFVRFSIYALFYSQSFREGLLQCSGDR